MSKIVDFIKKALRFIKNLVRYVINGILNFATHVVGWFKKIYYLDQERHVPFIANANNPEFKQMLNNAPVKNVGIFKGVYDETTDEIVEHEQVEADGLDNKTKQILGNETLVVLN